MANLKDFVRLCKSNQNGGFCNHTCPIFCGIEEAEGDSCFCYITHYTEEAEKIIDKWASEHPVKTYADDFFKKFPKAGKFDDGTPYDICVNSVYGTDFPCDESCKDCWNAECKEDNDA